MKKTLLFLILGLSLTTYSQDIEKMDKKELRIALKNSNASKDSLISINSNREKEIASLSQNLIVTKDSIKAQKVKITSLLSLKKQSDEKSIILTEKVSVLKDSIGKIHVSYTPLPPSQEDLENEEDIPTEFHCLGVWIGNAGGIQLTFIISNLDDIGFKGYYIVNNTVKSFSGPKLKDSKIAFEIFEERRLIGYLNLTFSFDEQDYKHKAKGVFKNINGSSENVTLSIDYNYNI
jgi:hypothetical protein